MCIYGQISCVRYIFWKYLLPVSDFSFSLCGFVKEKFQILIKCNLLFFGHMDLLLVVYPHFHHQTKDHADFLLYFSRIFIDLHFLFMWVVLHRYIYLIFAYRYPIYLVPFVTVTVVSPSDCLWSFSKELSITFRSIFEFSFLSIDLCVYFSTQYHSVLIAIVL